MQNIKEKIIEYITKNRVSTTEVADCLGKSGALEGIAPLNHRHFVCGEIRYICGVENSNWNIHLELEKLFSSQNPGRNILFVDGIAVDDRALFGDIVSKFILLYNRQLGIIVNGKVRDAHYLIKEDYPIWCKGVTPIGCFNNYVEIDKYLPIIEEKKELYDGAVAVCDDSGVVIIPKQMLNDEFYGKLEKIEEQEDIWYDCIDRKKWSTYKTICQKAYLKENRDE